MAKMTKAQRTLPRVQRLLEDQYVQEQLRDAVLALHTAYQRAVRKRAQAAEDKKLYASLRHAATSVRNAAVTLRRPEPPPTHHVRNTLIFVIGAATTALMTWRLQQNAAGAPDDQGSSSERDRSTSSSTVEPATAAVRS